MLFSFDCNTSFILIVSYRVMGCQVFEFNKFYFLKVGSFLKKLVEFGEGMPRVIHRFIHSLKISPGLWITLSTGLSTGLWIKLSTGFPQNYPQACG